jgi:hypothetical protein
MLAAEETSAGSKVLRALLQRTWFFKSTSPTDKTGCAVSTVDTKVIAAYRVQRLSILGLEGLASCQPEHLRHFLLVGSVRCTIDLALPSKVGVQLKLSIR